MSGGVAIVSVGGNTESEMRERKARVEDSLHATRAAIESGIVTGGGTALIRATKKCRDEGLFNDLFNNRDEEIGLNIVIKSITKPLKQLVENSGKDGSIVVERILEKEYPIGYDVSTGRYVDMLKSGIIDPTKVTRTALIHASSISGLLITTECIIIDEETDEDQTINN